MTFAVVVVVAGSAYVEVIVGEAALITFAAGLDAVDFRDREGLRTDVVGGVAPVIAFDIPDDDLNVAGRPTVVPDAIDYTDR